MSRTRLNIVFTITLLSGCTLSPDPAPAPVRADTTAVLSEPSGADEAAYDSLLAARLGADKYGMRRYVVAFLKSGPNRDQDSTTAATLQRQHLDNISRLAREGHLILAGPFLDDGELRGIYIFDVASTEEARALTASDPAIQTGRLVMDLHPWYGAAALMEIAALQARVTRESI